MAETGFQVDPAGMRSAASQIDGAGSLAARIIQTLQQQLAGLGQPWGTDDLGQSFAQQYVKPSQDGLDALGSVGAGLQGVAQNLSAMADNYEGVDSSVAQGFGQIHQELS
ncbi:MAG TPA: WXG100 family type VII secretion target [Actinocrinis sp.]|nr:WXG100 family type VII secretion target [Actinocrinis sp.]